MVYCFACGARLGPGHELGDSLRCHDCRDDGQPERPEPQAGKQLARPVLTLIKTFPRRPPEPPPFAA